MSVHSGRLEKKGGVNRYSWKWQFFTFDSAAMTVTYYNSSTADSSKLKGQGAVAGVEDVVDRAGKRQNRFDVKMDYLDRPGRGKSCVICCAAASPGEKAQWMSVIAAAARAKYISNARAMQGGGA